MRHVPAKGCLSVAILCLLCGVGLAGDPQAGREGGESTALRLPRDIELGPGTLDLGARLRTRYEWFDNFNLKTYGTNVSDQVLGERLWLDFAYRNGSNATAFVRLQDAHFWLSEFDDDDFTTAALPVCAHENPFDIREAYLDLRQLGGSPVGVKAGRQTVVYGDQRIWAPGDWSNSGKFTWDAVKLMWQSPAANVDGLYGRRVIPDPDEFDGDHYGFDAWGLYATLKQLPFELDCFYVLKADEHPATVGEAGTNTLALNAVGARLNWRPADGAEVGGTIVYEYGDWGDDDLEALGGVVSAGYTAPFSWKPGARLSYSYASGDRDPKDGRHETFDMLFGSGSQYYGLMNMVAWMNLHDYQIDLTARAGWLDKVLVSYHYFQLAEATDGWYYCTEKMVRRDKTGASGTDLGQEVDVVLGKTVSRCLSVDLGVCHFFAGEFAERVGEGKDADWVYAQSVLTF
jgi:hypothetical protein